MRKWLVSIVGLAGVMGLVFIGGVDGQTVVKNPSGLSLASVDHALVTSYEVDFTRASDSTVVQTITISNVPLIPLVGGQVVLPINVQPVAFGQYRFVARAVAGTSKSDNSVPSAIWERAPGKPSNLIVQ